MKKNKIQSDIIWLIFSLFVMIAAFLFVSFRAQASESPTVADIDKVIEMSLRGEYAAPASTDVGFRREIATALVNSSEKYNVPVLLLTAIAYRESRFRTKNQVGDGGLSLGMMQVGRQGRQRCSEACGSLQDAQEHTDCGACWLDQGRRWCGSLEGALSAYVCGKCKPIKPRAQWAVQNRLKLVNKFERFLSR